LNVHSPTKDKIDDMKDSFYEGLQHAFNKFPNCHKKILLQDFNAKVGREEISKPKIGNESLHEISNDNGIRVLNFATSKNVSKLQCSYFVAFINLFGRLLMERLTNKLTIF
jgi:hypothetical protein